MNQQDQTSTPFQGEPSHRQRLPFADRLNDNFRNHFVACTGEFIGTFFFLFFALSGTQVANTVPNPVNQDELSRLLYISLAFGFSLAVNAWVWFRVSGGLFNPAVSQYFILTLEAKGSANADAT